ncbi:hypothetical protein, partial [Marinimicrobium sp. UBA4209]|uniref:hypothetical protein n=1 Tax=Marinimicrobium sp. UBA4209 TaxID=1946810 RepID=UPI00257EE134
AVSVGPQALNAKRPLSSRSIFVFIRYLSCYGMTGSVSVGQLLWQMVRVTRDGRKVGPENRKVGSGTRGFRHFPQIWCDCWHSAFFFKTIWLYFGYSLIGK